MRIHSKESYIHVLGADLGAENTNMVSIQSPIIDIGYDIESKDNQKKIAIDKLGIHFTWDENEQFGIYARFA